MSLISFLCQLSEMRGLGGGSVKQWALCVFHGLLCLVEWQATETDWQGSEWEFISLCASCPNGFPDKGCGFLSSLSAIWLPMATGSKQLGHVVVFKKKTWEWNPKQEFGAIQLVEEPWWVAGNCSFLFPHSFCKLHSGWIVWVQIVLVLVLLTQIQ